MGRVIGVATRKSVKQEGMAFCIPAEEVNAALSRFESQPGSVPDQIASRQRSEVAFQILTTAGAIYGVGLEVRASLMRNSPSGIVPTAQLPDEIKKLDEVIRELDTKLFSLVDAQMPPLQSDASLTQPVRNQFQELTSSYKSMKDLYAVSNDAADPYTTKVRNLKSQHLRLVQSLENELKIPVPPKLLALFQAQPTDQPTLLADLVPPRYQSRFLRGRAGLSARMPMGPIGPRPSGALERSQQARDRMDALRARARGLRGR